MMDLSRLLEWQNLMFILPMAFALLMLGVSVFASLDNNPDTASGEVETDVSMTGKMLSALGIGKVPVSILIYCWCMLFGFWGFVLYNYIFLSLFYNMLLRVSAASIIAFFIALLGSSFMVRIIARFVPQLESYAEQKQDFINREAEVRYTVTATQGTVTLTDKYGNLQQMQVRLDASVSEAVPPGEKVILIAYDATENVFMAIPVRLPVSSHNVN